MCTCVFVYLCVCVCTCVCVCVPVYVCTSCCCPFSPCDILCSIHSSKFIHPHTSTRIHAKKYIHHKTRIPPNNTSTTPPPPRTPQHYRFLVRLLLVHGTLCHYRLARLIKYSFYKNICFAFVLFYFQFFCGFSGMVVCCCCCCCCVCVHVIVYMLLCTWVHVIVYMGACHCVPCTSITTHHFLCFSTHPFLLCCFHIYIHTQHRTNTY